MNNDTSKNDDVDDGNDLFSLCCYKKAYCVLVVVIAVKKKIVYKIFFQNSYRDSWQRCHRYLWRWYTPGTVQTEQWTGSPQCPLWTQRADSRSLDKTKVNGVKLKIRYNCVYKTYSRYYMLLIHGKIKENKHDKVNVSTNWCIHIIKSSFSFLQRKIPRFLQI